MKYLLWFDATLAAVGGVMAISVGFVGGVFWLYLDASPKARSGLPSVAIITACFTAVFCLALTAFLGLRRSRSWHWAAQSLLVLALPLTYELIIAQLQTQ